MINTVGKLGILLFLAAAGTSALAVATAPSTPTGTAAQDATSGQAPPASPAAAVPASASLRVLTTPVLAEIPVSAADEALFPHYPQLKTPIAFWTRVFGDWSENQSVLHSTDDLSKVFTVLDFRDEAVTLNPVALAVLKFREESQAREDTRKLLLQVDALQATPQDLNPEQRRIYDLFADSSDPRRFKDAIDSLRIQRGLRERTQHALAVSGRYMPQMESIFASYGLPRILTRLPLMESSFNLDAYSKAGAAGVWQFIPSSARMYMRLNEVVDDRRDPWFSTDAAARHLKDDYDMLRDWPLALTAYNYGRGGVAHALRDVDGTTLIDVIQRYQSRRFGFASRNYYAEFLAAADVERNWRRYFGDVSRDAPVPFELVETRDYVPYETVRRLCGVDALTFRTLNPAFREEVIDGKLYVPPAHPIRVPEGAAERFRVAYSALAEGERFDRQRLFYATYRIQRGDSVGKLARRYGISAKALLALNGLSNGKMRAGQTLKVPLGSVPSTTQLAMAEDSAREARAIKVSTRAESPVKRAAKTLKTTVKTHRVESGQTLGGIAQRYSTSVALIRKLNGLRGDHLRVGTRLRIPGA